MQKSDGSKSNVYRLLNRDGTFNIERRGARRFSARDTYHFLLSLSWPTLLLTLLVFYLSVNVVFATAYYFVGAEGLTGHSSTTQEPMDFYWTCFFFSVQTFATIGYGKLTPIGMLPNILVTLEAFTGLLMVALATGLVFARFSKPTARVVFSRSAIVSPIDGVDSFTMRMANARFNQIVEAQVRMILAIDEFTAEGDRYRNLYDLEVERSHSPIFVLSWTVVHPITAKSPLFNKAKEDLIKGNAEIFVTMSGIDDTFSQTIHSRTSYVAEDVFWNRRFKDILSREEGKVKVDLNNIHTLEEST